MRYLIVAAAAAMAMAAPAAAQQNVGGRYQAQGQNFDGSPYSGAAEITVTSDNTCRIVWRTGGTTSQGICMRNGSTLAASYQLGRSVGLVIYQIADDGSLRGLWTIADKSGVGRELLTPVK